MLDTVGQVTEVRADVDDATRRLWTEIAQGSRMTHYAFSLVGDPAPGSNFAQINAVYPFEKSSDWSRNYILAAYEHLLLWADYVAPFRFHPEQVITHNLRPTYTLARAALEASAQAVWMQSGGTAKECARRHLKLVRWDFEEHRKSKRTEESKQALTDRDELLVLRASNLFESDELRPMDGYLTVLVAAARIIDKEPEDIERIWRAASGAAHGKYWPSLDLQSIVTGDEYEPGHFRTTRFPNTELMTEALRTASLMTRHAALQYMDFSGADIADLLVAGRKWLAGQITLSEDADPEIVRRMLSDAPLGTAGHDSSEQMTPATGQGQDDCHVTHD